MDIAIILVQTSKILRKTLETLQNSSFDQRTYTLQFEVGYF